MREILIADKSGERCDVGLLCVYAVQILPDFQCACMVRDGIVLTVTRECVHQIGRISLGGWSPPASDGLWAFTDAGKWVEARRQ
mgnify:FL=1